MKKFYCYFCSQNNAPQKREKNEMAFRLHHYEALKSDKESLQMPLNGMFRGQG
jgi:galactose-1-phosphate uridylyltransferase